MSLDELREQLLNVADSAIKTARDLNVPSAEAYVSSQTLTNLSDNNGKIESRDGVVQGVGIRVAIGKQLGFASCSSFEKETIRKTIEGAHAIAKSSPENPLFPGFTTESRKAKEGILDPEITQLDAISLGNYLDTIDKEIDKTDQRILTTILSANSSWQGYAVATTEGCLAESLSTSFSSSAVLVVMEAGDRKTGYDFVTGRKISDVDGLGTKAMKDALEKLGSKPFEGSEILPTVWRPRFASSFLSIVFQTCLSGTTYVEKSNPWKDKLEEKVAVKDFNLIDKGQTPEYPGCHAIDTEGTAKQETDLITEGIFKTFLFDRMYGKAANKESTGNAARFGSIPYEVPPLVAPSKCIVNNIGKTVDQQISEIDRGILVTATPTGIQFANQITGDFSGSSSESFLIVDGEIKESLKPISIAGNLYESLKNILFIGSDREITGGLIDSPAITFEGHTISG